MSKYRKLFSASVLVMGLGLAANLVGLAKEQLVAYFYGAGDAVDVFSIGLALPLLFSTLVASSVSAAVIPAFMAARERGEELRFLYEAALLMLAFVLLIMVVCAVAGVALMPYLAHGFSRQKLLTAMSVVLILSPIIVLQSLGSLMDGVLNAKQRYVLSSCSNALIPIGTVVLLLLWPSGGVIALCAGLYLGYSMKALVLLWDLPAQFWCQFRTVRLEWLAMCRRHLIMIREFMFLLFSSVILGLLPVIGQAYAASLPPGSVATLSYANRLLGVGLVLVSGAINAIVLPALAQEQLRGAGGAASLGTKLALTAVGVGFVLATPAYFLLEPVVRLLFERGAFTAEDTQKVAYVLTYFLPYVPLYICGLILARVVVSIGASRVFVIGNILSLLLYWGACEVLIKSQGLAGVGMALTLVYFVSCLYLLFSIRKHGRAV